MKRAIPIILMLALVPLVPARAQLGLVGPNNPPQPGNAAPEMLFGEILIDTYGTSGVIATLDRRFGIEPEDGITDLVITFEASEPLRELVRLRGFGFVKAEEREVSLILPQEGKSLRFSMDSETGTVGDVRVFHGNSLAYSTPPTKLEMSLGEAMAREQERQASLVRSAVASIFQKDPDPGGGSGELCKSSCSATCTDGSNCNISCNSTQCAECDCPANCYCRARSGV